jgi:hypothetical protein
VLRQRPGQDRDGSNAKDSNRPTPNLEAHVFAFAIVLQDERGRLPRRFPRGNSWHASNLGGSASALVKFWRPVSRDAIALTQRYLNGMRHSRLIAMKPPGAFGSDVQPLAGLHDQRSIRPQPSTARRFLECPWRPPMSSPIPRVSPARLPSSKTRSALSGGSRLRSRSHPLRGRCASVPSS